MRKNNNFIPTFLDKDRVLLNYPDCVYLNEYGKCSILQGNCCFGENCSFFQNNIGQAISISKRDQRLNSLDEEKQKKIANIYYGGERPWKN